jgi:hypothetical protein
MRGCHLRVFRCQVRNCLVFVYSLPICFIAFNSAIRLKRTPVKVLANVRADIPLTFGPLQLAQSHIGRDVTQPLSGRLRRGTKTSKYFAETNL